MFQMSEVKRTTCLRFITLALIAFFCTSNSLAQRQSQNGPPAPSDMGADKGSPNDQRSPLTTFEEEMRAKRAIKLAEKDHEENLKRAREISELGQNLKSSLNSRSSLDREDNKKLDRLEKLTKKIRGEAGGDDDDVTIQNAPSDISTAVCKIADEAELLSKEVQKTPRQVVSASVIDRANVLLELVRILRTFTRKF